MSGHISRGNELGSMRAALLPSEIDQPRIVALADEIDHMKMVMRECCDAIRDGDELGALRMMEVCLQGGGRQ